MLKEAKKDAYDNLFIVAMFTGMRQGELLGLSWDNVNFKTGQITIKRAREASGMTQEQLAYIVDRAPRTIMYNENDGQHPSFNTFYQMVTMFDISVDQYFYPSQNSGSECRKRIDAMLNALDERELKIVEATIQAMKASKETEET